MACLLCACVWMLSQYISDFFPFKSGQLSKYSFVLRNIAAHSDFLKKCSKILLIHALKAFMHSIVFAQQWFLRLRWALSASVFMCLYHPLGRKVCVSEGECLGTCGFPVTKHSNREPGFSHKAIGIIYWVNKKIPATPSLWMSRVRVEQVS